MEETESSSGPLAGRFDLLGEIGSGASGTVYRARIRRAYGELPAGTEVAVKFLRQDRLADPVARKALLAEGRLGSRLRSPHVARIYGVETLELMGLESTYLVMELVEGTSLRELLERSGPVVEDLARRIGMDAARGLEALHRLGVVHRDLKPENLAITPAGHVKLMDLGLATSYAPGSSQRSSFAGSVAYGAPEVLRGGPASPRSDLYSLGVVLFEVATGRHPFAPHREVDDLLHAHLEEPAPRASHIRPRVSAFLEELIGELMAKDPEQRPATARALAQTLQLGEQSPYWRERERRLPVLASRRRLNRLRRPAPSPFVGRELQLEVLNRHFADAAAGRGTALRVYGAEGVGRRRLLDESATRWLENPDGPVFLGGEAEPGLSEGLGMPFSHMLLDWYLRGDRPDSPNVPDRLAVRVRREGGMGEEDAVNLAAVISGTATDHPSEVRADLLARGLLHLTAAHPVVIRVDRADQLGTTGALVLERLMEEARNHRLLLLTVTGTGEDAGRFAGEHLQLQAMSEAEFTALGRSLFRNGNLGEAFLEAAYGTLAGNPANLIQALDHLVQQGLLQGRPGDFHGLKVDAPRPAPHMVSRLQARVNSLPEGERQVFASAAVLGEHFHIAELTRLSGQSQLQVLQALSAFQGGIARAVEGRGRFLHSDYRRALLRGIPDLERRRLHREAATILRARGAGPLAIGMHLSRAGEHQACLDPLLSGLAQLVARGSRRSAPRLLARLRVHLDAVPVTRENQARRLRFGLLASRTLVLTGRPDRALQSYLDATRLARGLDDPAAAGEALTGMATLALEAGQFFTAQSLLEQAHLALGETGSTRLAAARAFGLHARVLAYLGQSERSLDYLRRAQRAIPARDTGYLPHLLIDRARVERLGYHFSTALKNLRRAERLVQYHRLPVALLRVQLYRGQIFSEINDEQAQDQLRGALEGARRLSSHRIQAKALLFLGEHELRRGNRGPAEDLLSDAVHLAHRASDRLTAAQACVLLTDVGIYSAGLEQTVDDLGAPALKVAWLLAEARRHGVLGRPEMVRVCADEAMDLAKVAALPLFLHLQVLRRTGAQGAARVLIDEIASRLPPGTARRRFTAQAAGAD